MIISLHFLTGLKIISIGINFRIIFLDCSYRTMLKPLYLFVIHPDNYTKDTLFLTKKMNYVEISYSKRRPKKLENDVFVLYTPERIKLQPGEIKVVDMKLHLKLSKNLLRICVLLPSLTSQNIKLLNAYHISTDSLMLEDSPYKVIFETQEET